MRARSLEQRFLQPGCYACCYVSETSRFARSPRTYAPRGAPVRARRRTPTPGSSDGYSKTSANLLAGMASRHVNQAHVPWLSARVHTR